MLQLLDDIDKWLFLVINGLHHPFLDQFFVIVTAKWTWIPFYAILAYVIFKHHKQSFFLIVLSVVVAITLSDQVASSIIKPLAERLRPCHETELQNRVHIVNDYCGGRFGFVSSHAANVFALATLLMLILEQRRLTILLFVWASLVSLSRVYLGVHYPGDIIGGALIGSGISVIVYKLYHLMSKKFIKAVAESTHEQ
jgi:undecaprenyl-diphosphatase